MLDERVMNAQREIAAVLQKLEIETGRVIDNISMQQVETTNIDSVEREYRRSIRIDLRETPGERWAA